MNLSDRELELYEFIKNNEGITVKQIQGQLSPQHVGAIGKLFRQNLIKKEKRREGETNYSLKIVTYYIINKEGEKNGICQS